MDNNGTFDGARAMNKMAVACHTVIVAVLEIAYLIEVLKGSRTIGYYVVFSLVAILPVALAVFLYNREPSDTRLKYVIGVTYSLFYLFVVFTTVSMLAFTYIIPICLVLILYSDVKLCAGVSGAGVVINLAFLVWQGMTGGIRAEDMATYEIRMALLLLVAVFLCLATKTLEKINAAKLAELDREKDNVSELLEKVMRISEQMSGGILDVAGQMRELGSAVSETRDAMQEVSAGTNETAQSIQNQLGQTEEIQNHIGQMADVMEAITQHMAETKESVRLGRENLQILNRQMEHSEKAGAQAVEEMEGLAEYTANMQTIIDMITSVASQTSLLALNASIEAARAGEAGRGFAVVATEISNLANQTQGATVDITDVIRSVSDKLKTAAGTVEELMESNRRQSESAVHAADSFEKIAADTDQVDEQSRRLDGSVKQLAEANRVIVESIQTISAIMQEVSAHSQETFRVSENNTKIVAEVDRLVEDLSGQAKQLNQSRS
ncbi:MAG: hypothetical protein K2M20_04455 [Lachnospiraceae bacterium]|nr:hypothetical protein [Lachnospiraceae bacterium]MDE6603066.1 hypothetical protein [Lachnospiraceae bacterium]